MRSLYACVDHHTRAPAPASRPELPGRARLGGVDEALRRVHEEASEALGREFEHSENPDERFRLGARPNPCTAGSADIERQRDFARQTTHLLRRAASCRLDRTQRLAAESATTYRHAASAHEQAQGSVTRGATSGAGGLLGSLGGQEDGPGQRQQHDDEDHQQ